MEISGVTDMVQLCLLISNFQQQLPDRISHISFAVSQNIHSPFNWPHAMSPKTGAFIFNEALACIGQRIASILIQPANKDKNYIISLHNKVVGIS